MKRIQLATILVLTLVVGVGQLAFAGSGAGAINLSFPIGARYNALGEAGTALAQDATAIWWNPGGLAFHGTENARRELHIMQSALAAGLADDIGLYWGGYAAPTGSGTLGMAINYLDMGNQIAMDEDGNERGEFTSYMFALQAAYGVAVAPNVGFGLGVKYFRDKLAPDSVMQDAGGSGDSFGVDLGVLWKVPALKANFGMAVANLGPNIKHVDADQSDPMPRKVTLGLAKSLFNSEASSLLVVGDYQIPLYKYDMGDEKWGLGFDFDQTEYGYGVEWSYVNSLFIRFGYKSAEYGDISDTTYGFGLDLMRWVGQALTFDYVSVPQASSLDRVTRISLGYRF